MNVDARYLREKIKRKIISFEGLDCSFKETNHRAFVEHLKNFIGASKILIGPRDIDANHMERVYTESFPRYSNESSYFVKSWLNGAYDRKSLEPEVICQLYAIDRFDYWNRLDENQISNYKRLESGACFVFDRYSSSNAIYNPRYRHVSYEDLEFDIKNYYNPKPNIVFMMVMNDFEVLERLLYEKKNKDQNELDIEFIHKAYMNMYSLIDNGIFDRVDITLIPIDCIDSNGNIKSKEELANEIWDSFLDYIVINDISEKYKKKG